MMVESKNKMDKSDLKCKIFYISNSNLKLFLSPYGASVQKIYIKSKNDAFKNIALSFRKNSDYCHNSLFAGATLAPTAGRIEDGILSLDGITYQLTKNENNQNHLHGGIHNLSFREWNLIHQTETSAIFSSFLEDKVDGYPGNRRFYVSYKLKENMVEISQKAESDKETYFNMSNHTYFNLNGFSSSGLDQILKISADKVIYNNEIHIPQKAENVKNTAFDFLQYTNIAEQLKKHCDNKQLIFAKGFNHYFILSDDDIGLPACSLRSADKSIQMDMYTDAPSFVLYTGGFIDSSFQYQKKDNIFYPTYPGCAIAIEPSYLPFHHVCTCGTKHFERTIRLVFHSKNC